MFSNQQLKESRVVVLTAPRLLVLVAFIAAAGLLVGCKSAPAEEARPPAAPCARRAARLTDADDLTATEAAIAAMNEVRPPEAPAQTAQLIRPDAPMNYTVKRGDTLGTSPRCSSRIRGSGPRSGRSIPQVENPHLIYPGDVLSLAYGANGDAHVSISQYSGARLQPRLRSDGSTARSTRFRSRPSRRSCPSPAC
jgi:hypothetical protein